MIRITSVDTEVEKQIVSNLIWNDDFIVRVMKFFRLELLETVCSRTVSSWCMEYFKQYEHAPKEVIFDILLTKGEEIDHALLTQISTFLDHLKAHHTQVDNVDYLIDKAELFFRSRSLSALNKRLNAFLSDGRVMEAEAELAKYTLVKKEDTKGVNPFVDPDRLEAAFEKNIEPLFELPSGLGHILNDHLVPNGFIAIMGAEKSGKSWFLEEFAVQAAWARNNVAYFQVGDMSEDQVVRRFGIRLTGRPDREKYCGDIEVPYADCVFNQQNLCHKQCRRGSVGCISKDGTIQYSASYLPCAECYEYERAIYRKTLHVEKLEWRDVYQAGHKFMSWYRGRQFRLATYPNRTINVKGITAQLDIWERFDGYVPSIVIIDYADILAPENTKNEFRHQQNDTWQALRTLSQERNLLVITATQANAGSYSATTLGKENFSEDKRKYAHVTCFLTINRDAEDIKNSTVRIGQLFVREGECYEAGTVLVTQCLKIGRPIVDVFPYKIEK